jgi:hypothetical protein
MAAFIRGSWTFGRFNEEKFAKSILLFWNAPWSGGGSPEQLIFYHPVRDCLPAYHRSFAPKWQKAAGLLEKHAKRSKQLQIAHYNIRMRPLAEFVVETNIPSVSCCGAPPK